MSSPTPNAILDPTGRTPVPRGTTGAPRAARRAALPGARRGRGAPPQHHAARRRHVRLTATTRATTSELGWDTDDSWIRPAVAGKPVLTAHGMAVTVGPAFRVFFNEIGALLVAEHGAAEVVLRRTKQAFALPAPDELVAEFVDGCDVVITGVGDCGSCSASAVADGVVFEAAGLPAAVICSDAFVTTADAMADLRGAPGYAYATTAHPVAVLAPEQVAERAKHLVADVVALLTEGGR